MMGREVIIGRLKCHRYRRLRGGSALSVVLRDILDPLPAHELWVIDSTTDGAKYRTRSGRLPTCLATVAEGSEVVIRANVDRWSNGLGAYISRCALQSVRTPE